MSRPARILALLLLALLVPLQGYAAVCAQICALAGHSQAPAAMQHGEPAAHHGDGHAGGDAHGHGDAPGHGEAPGHGGHDTAAALAQGDAPAHEDCGESALGAGKCCQAHVVAIDQPNPAAAVEATAIAPGFFVARWTNFIPEEPSPPPIGAAPSA
jgi:hypothetical protein